MRLLLDTHAFLWFAWGDPQLSSNARSLIEDPANQKLLSVASIERRHSIHVAALPLHHRDPFDRMLAAQCLVEALSLISADPALDAYRMSRLW